MTVNADRMLPPLHPEIKLLPGPTGDDGAPTGILFDTRRQTFDKFGWMEGEILSRLRRPIGLDALHARLGAETSIRIDREDLAAFLGQLHARGLLLTPHDGSGPAEAKKTGGALSWLLGHYLFFRAPLLHPDAFLRKTLWLPRFFGSRPMTAFTLLVATAAILLFIPRSGVFFQSAAPFIAWGGAPWLGGALIVVKILHEFSHAYAAAVRKVTVRSMGIFFMVMTPIPYCDVTDAWRLPRGQRLAISFAGVRTELTVAAFSLLAWSLSPPGVVRDILLVLCTASVLSTLLTNLNPGMRFDGYYLFSDLIGVDNLQQTALAELRAFYRGRLLGLEESRDVPGMTRRKRVLLIFYSAYAIAYRLTVYFGIAILVYHYFPKVLGVFLFLLELAVFVVGPAVRETAATRRLIREKGITMRLTGFLLAAAGVLLWLFLPLPRTVRLEAAVSSPDILNIYAPDSGRLTGVPPRRGDRFLPGDTLLSMQNESLEREITRRELEHDNALTRLEAARAIPEGKNRIQSTVADAGRASSALAALHARRALQRIVAETELIALEVDDQFYPGNHVAKRAFLAKFAPVAATRRITAYLPEESLREVEAGDKAAFVSNADPGREIAVTIAGIMRQSSREIEEPALTGPMGGNLPVQAGPDGQPVAAAALYRVEAVLDADAQGDSLRIGQTGVLYVRGRASSPGMKFLTGIGHTLLRESGF